MKDEGDVDGLRCLHLLLEGPTEETVVRDFLGPYLQEVGWDVRASKIITKRAASGRTHRGGVGSWSHLEGEIRRHLRDPNLTILSTVIDYYAFPADAPGMATRPTGDARVRVEHVEQTLSSAIGDDRFLPHLTLHELEAWVFAAADQLGELYGSGKITAELRRDIAKAGGPELVNDGVSTAPSKRLIKYRPSYMKTIDGPLAVASLGLPGLRAQCPHLDAWLTQLERVAGVG